MTRKQIIAGKGGDMNQGIGIRNRKIWTVLFCFLALAAFAAWAPSADAYQTITNCAGCHTFGSSSSTFHQGHLNLGLPQSCQTCHVQTGDTPNTSRCGTCHVAPGLPRHHQTTGASSCTSCHSGTPAPENTPVPGYATTTVALDPCNGSEERFSSLTISLDNDGDGLYDMNDPDCQTTPANRPPVLGAIGPKSGTVGTPVTFTATATDPDAGQTRTFSLGAGAPAGATINGSTGAFSWTPTAVGTPSVTVRVTDNGSPALFDEEAITVTVTAAANRPPVLGAIGNKSGTVGTPVTFTATATDPDAGQTRTSRSARALPRERRSTVRRVPSAGPPRRWGPPRHRAGHRQRQPRPVRRGGDHRDGDRSRQPTSCTRCDRQQVGHGGNAGNVHGDRDRPRCGSDPHLLARRGRSRGSDDQRFDGCLQLDPHGGGVPQRHRAGHRQRQPRPVRRGGDHRDGDRSRQPTSCTRCDRQQVGHGGNAGNVHGDRDRPRCGSDPHLLARRGRSRGSDDQRFDGCLQLDPHGGRGPPASPCGSPTTAAPPCSTRRRSP